MEREMYVCVSKCVCVWERERERERTNACKRGEGEGREDKGESKLGERRLLASACL